MNVFVFCNAMLLFANHELRGDGMRFIESF